MEHLQLQIPALNAFFLILFPFGWGRKSYFSWHFNSVSIESISLKCIVYISQFDYVPLTIEWQANQSQLFSTWPRNNGSAQISFECSWNSFRNWNAICSRYYCCSASRVNKVIETGASEAEAESDSEGKRINKQTRGQNGDLTSKCPKGLQMDAGSAFMQMMEKSIPVRYSFLVEIKWGIRSGDNGMANIFFGSIKWFFESWIMKCTPQYVTIKTTKTLFERCWNTFLYFIWIKDVNLLWNSLDENKFNIVPLRFQPC